VRLSRATKTHGLDYSYLGRTSALSKLAHREAIAPRFR
jgi:hypothetical protein